MKSSTKVNFFSSAAGMLISGVENIFGIVSKTSKSDSAIISRILAPA